jgi:hypothetical protein
MNECDLAIVMFPNCWIFYPIKDKEKQIRWCNRMHGMIHNKNFWNSYFLLTS